jgi:hypothetical protein
LGVKVGHFAVLRFGVEGNAVQWRTALLHARTMTPVRLLCKRNPVLCLTLR